MSFVAHIAVRPLRVAVAVFALAALVMGAVPAAACADGDDCGMTTRSAGSPSCGGDSCPLAAAVVAMAPAPGSAADGSFACCAGPELGTQAPALLSAERPEDALSSASVTGAPVAVVTSAAAPALAERPIPRPPDHARPGDGSVALHRLLSIDLC